MFCFVVSPADDGGAGFALPIDIRYYAGQSTAQLPRTSLLRMCERTLVPCATHNVTMFSSADDDGAGFALTAETTSELS